MEEYMESQGSFVGGIFCVDGSIKKDECCGGGVVYMCKKSGESIDHLLIHCKVARKLWSSILNLLGVEWVMSRWVIGLLSNWGG